LSNLHLIDHAEAVPVQKLTPDRRRELTRTALVEAAADVFARRGFYAASLDEIAEAAGFTRGAIYSNFGGKEDLLFAVLDLYTEQQLQAFGAAIHPGAGEPTEVRQAAAAGVWAATQREQNLAALSLEMRLYALRNPEFRRRLAQSERRQQERIAAFITEVATLEGRELPVDPIDLAYVLRAFSDGLSQIRSVDQDHGDYYDKLAGFFFGMIERAMGEEKPPSSR
jgi:AcrR family transcriptional regulator